MWNYIAKRLIFMVFTLLVITVASYTMMRLAPGDPTKGRLVGGDQAKAGVRDAERSESAGLKELRKKYHLDKNPLVGYGYWLKGIVTRGDFGTSIVVDSGTPVTQVIAQRMPPTIKLNVVSILIFYALAIPLGIYATVRHRRSDERIVTVILFLLYSMPVFWVGLLLLLASGNASFLRVFGLINALAWPAALALGAVLALRAVVRHGEARADAKGAAYFLLCALPFLIGACLLSRHFALPRAVALWGNVAGWAAVAAVAVLIGLRGAGRTRGLPAGAGYLLGIVPVLLFGALMYRFFAGTPPVAGLGPSLGEMRGKDTWAILLDTARYYVLPVICLTYGGFASLSRFMRVGLLEVIRQDYIRTARAKGVPRWRVIMVHALRNGMLPLITLFAGLLPGLVAGSVIVEYIFSIPGMGSLSLLAVNSRDYPLLMALFSMGALLTLVGILISDICYAVVDPRITFD